MGIFKDMRGGHFKPGPGVDKPPPTSGFPRFWFILHTHPGKLIIANMLFCIFAIPIITLPAAFCGLNSVISQLFRTGHCYPMAEFFEGFKSRFLQKTFYGLAYFVVLFGFVFIISYGVRGILLIGAAVIAYYFYIASCSFFVMLTVDDVHIRQVFIESLIAPVSFMRIIRLLPAAAISALFVFSRSQLLIPLYMIIGLSIIVMLIYAAVFE